MSRVWICVASPRLLYLPLVLCIRISCPQGNRAATESCEDALSREDSAPRGLRPFARQLRSFPNARCFGTASGTLTNSSEPGEEERPSLGKPFAKAKRGSGSLFWRVPQLAVIGSVGQMTRDHSRSEWNPCGTKQADISFAEEQTRGLGARQVEGIRSGSSKGVSSHE